MSGDWDAFEGVRAEEILEKERIFYDTIDVFKSMAVRNLGFSNESLWAAAEANVRFVHDKYSEFRKSIKQTEQVN